MTEAGALALLMGFMPLTSGALISTRPGQGEGVGGRSGGEG